MTKLRAWLPLFFFANAFLFFMTISAGKISGFFVMRLGPQWHGAALASLARMSFLTLWEIFRRADGKPGKVWLIATALEILTVTVLSFVIWNL